MGSCLSFGEDSFSPIRDYAGGNKDNANNRAVMEAYGFSTKMSEADCVAELMKMYQKLTEEK